MICDPAADPVKRFCLLCTTVNFVTENRSRMQILPCPSLLDVDRAGSVVDTFNSTEFARGCFHLVTRSNLRFLRRELITVDRTGHSAADPLHELHTGEAVAFFEKFIVGELVVNESTPTRELSLRADATPSCAQASSRLRSGLRRPASLGNAGEQTLHQCDDALSTFIHGFRGITRLDWWSRDDVSAVDERAPEFFQPISKVKCRDAVLAIVIFDRLQASGGTLSISPSSRARSRLVRLVPGIPEICLPFKSEESFEVLQRIPFHAGPQRLFDNPVQIHKHAGPQQSIDFVFARGISPHESFQRRGLVMGEVIHVKFRKALLLFNNEIDEGLECLALARTIKRPARRVLRGIVLPMLT